MRQSKGLSQEEMAVKLDMSLNGYTNIERGETDVQISRLEQIAEIFELDLLDLMSFGERCVIYQTGKDSIGIGQVNKHSQVVNHQHCEHELEKAKLLIEQRDKEILYLKEIIELMKSKPVE